MSQDSFTEVTNESWFSRIGGAIKGILVGLLLFVVAFPVLVWNEGRSVKTYKALKEGGGAVVTVSSESIDAANEGTLVHMTGNAVTDSKLTDTVFGVSVNAIKLKRVVEMYQWKEKSSSKTKKKVGGGTETVKTYTYSKAWSATAISSGNFKKPSGHQNPGSFPFESVNKVAKKVTLGAFTLSSSLVGKINNFEQFPIENNVKLPKSLSNKVKLHNAGFYVGTDPTLPKVGDMRVNYKVAKPAETSVISKQVGSTFEPYGTKAGKNIELLETGVHTAAAMIEKAQANNKMLAWFLRLGGFLLMFIGLKMVLKLLSVIADVLPILGTIVGVGTGIIAFLITAVLSLLTIAIAWVVYRPLLGIILLIVVVGLVMLIRGKLKTAKTV